MARLSSPLARNHAVSSPETSSMMQGDASFVVVKLQSTVKFNNGGFFFYNKMQQYQRNKSLGRKKLPATFYATGGGIAAAFISVFFSFGYLRLAEKLLRTTNDPSKAPPRADVVRSLKNGILVNLLGIGFAILGMQAIVGCLLQRP